MDSHSLPQTPHQVVQQPATIQPQYVPVPQGVLPPPNPQRPFICEWAGCMKDFRTPKEVEKHAIVTPKPKHFIEGDIFLDRESECEMCLKYFSVWRWLSLRQNW